MKKKGANPSQTGNPKQLLLFQQPYAQLVKKQNTSSAKNGRHSDIQKSASNLGLGPHGVKKRSQNSRDKAKAKGTSDIARKVSVASLATSDKALSLINLKIQVNDGSLQENQTSEQSRIYQSKSTITNPPEDAHMTERVDTSEMPSFNANISIQKSIKPKKANSDIQPSVLADVTNKKEEAKEDDKICEKANEIDSKAPSDDEQLKQLMNQQSQVLQANLEHHRDLSNLQRLRNSKNNSFGYLFQKNAQLNSDVHNQLTIAATNQTASTESITQKKSSRHAPNQSLHVKGSVLNQTNIPILQPARNRKSRQKSSALSHVKYNKNPQKLSLQQSSNSISIDIKKSMNVRNENLNKTSLHAYKSVPTQMKVPEQAKTQKKLAKGSATAQAKQKLLSKYKSAQGVGIKKKNDTNNAIKQLLKVKNTKLETDSLSKGQIKMKKRKPYASTSINMKQSRKIKNMSIQHEVSSNGGGIATNRSIRTQFSKASQRFMKSATPNRSVTMRSVNQLSDNESVMNTLLQQNKKKKMSMKMDSKFKTRSLSLASEKVHRSVKAQDQGHSAKRRQYKSIGRQLQKNLINQCIALNQPQTTHQRNANQNLVSQRTFNLSQNTNRLKKLQENNPQNANKKAPLTNRQLKQHIKSSIHAQNKGRLRQILSPPLKSSRQRNLEQFKLSEQSQYRRSELQKRGKDMGPKSKSKDRDLDMPLSSRRNGPQSSRVDGQLSSRREGNGNYTARFNQTKLSQSSKNHTIDKPTTKHKIKKDSKSPRNHVSQNNSKLSNLKSQNENSKQKIIVKSKQIKVDKSKKLSKNDQKVAVQILQVPEKSIKVQYVQSDAQSQVISIDAQDTNELKNKITIDCVQEQQSFAIEEKIDRKENKEYQEIEIEQMNANIGNSGSKGEKNDAFSIRSPDNSCPIPMSQEELISSTFPNNYENFESEQIDEQNRQTEDKGEISLSQAVDEVKQIKQLNRIDQNTPHQVMLKKNDDDFNAALLQYKQMSQGEINWQNPNHSIVRSASTKSTKSSLKLGQGNFCNPFCINGKVQQVMEQHNRRTGVNGRDYANNQSGLSNLFNCGFISEPFSKCMIKTCIPGSGLDPFNNQRLHNSSFNMVYPGIIDHSDDSLTNVPQPIDVGLRGEHHLDTEASENAKNQHNAKQNNFNQPKITGQLSKDQNMGNGEGFINDPVGSYVTHTQRVVQKVSNHKKNRTSDLRKYLNHSTSANVDYSNKVSNCQIPMQSAIMSNKLAAIPYDSNIIRHTQSCHDSKANPAFIDQQKFNRKQIQKDQRIEKYNQMLKLIDLKQNNRNGIQMKSPFEGSLLPPPSENSQNFYSESPLKKVTSQPQFTKKEPLTRPNFDGSQGIKKESTSPDADMLKQIVENSSQIKNKFDRQTIINNFFNLQTTEVHLRNSNTDYSKSGASKASHPSPYIDVQKVFYNQEVNSDDYNLQYIPKHMNSNETQKQNQFVQGTTNIHSPTFGQFADGQQENSETANDILAQTNEQTSQDLPPVNNQTENHMLRSMHDKQDLTQEHYNQILNTVMNLHLLEQYNQMYKQLPRITIPSWDTQDSKFLLILDIDETMMHAIDERDGPDMRFQFTIDIPHETIKNQTEQIHLNLRPHLLESLHELAGKFYITSYTASEQTYADAVLDFIEYQYLKKYPCSQIRNLFPTRLYRQHCVATPYGCIKDLKIIDNVSLTKMIIIDNSCLSYALNIDNGVPILPYYDSERDEELKHLTYYLNCLVEQGVEDVRVHNREAFGLMKLKESDSDARGRGQERDSVVGKFDEFGIKNVESELDTARFQKPGSQVAQQQLNNSTQSVNPQHLASSEYLQCDPIEIKDFQHFDSVNQIAACDQDAVGTNQTQLNETECQGTFNEPFIMGDDKKINVQEEAGPMSMEKIEEKISEEDECTSFKKRDDRWVA